MSIYGKHFTVILGPMEKLFVIRKYIMAESAMKAIKREGEYPVHDVWIDDDWFKETKAQPDASKILQGFRTMKSKKKGGKKC